jgi:hypothetical protein
MKDECLNIFDRFIMPVHVRNALYILADVDMKA